MSRTLKYRSALADAKRVVVKIGSRVLVQKTGRPDVRRMQAIVKGLARLQRSGHQIVVVSSGAVGAGMEALGMKSRPDQLPDIQMAAAVGQIRLMTRYHDFFKAEKSDVGQVLLTHDDFHSTLRVANARRTMENMLRHGVIPIVNENDVVADEELKAELKKLGDNDLLAALVVKLIRADLLLMLTTVNGYSEPGPSGRRRRVSVLENITPKILRTADSMQGSALSTGGMRSKLKAARSAAQAGCNVAIANGREAHVIQSIMAGKDIGTLIPAAPL